MLADYTFGGTAHTLADGVIQLGATRAERRQTCGELLRLLTYECETGRVYDLVTRVVQLAQTADDRRQANGALLAEIARRCQGGGAVDSLAHGLVALTQTAEDKRLAREALVTFLPRNSEEWPHASQTVAGLVNALIKLGPLAEDKRRARRAVIGCLTTGRSTWVEDELVRRLARLDPTVSDLQTWRTWGVRPTAELLAALRRNSAAAAWLAALPSLAALSELPASLTEFRYLISRSKQNLMWQMIGRIGREKSYLFHRKGCG